MAMHSPSTQGAAGMSFGLGAAITGLIVWILSLCHVVVPADQVAELTLVVGAALHWLFGAKPKIATSATITAKPE